MSRFLKRALESVQPKSPVVAKGPLGEAMTKALNVALAKNDPVTGAPRVDGSALESQQQEVTLVDKLVNGINAQSDGGDSQVEIYAIPASEVDSDTVVEVINDITQSPEENEYVVIADDGAPQVLDGSGAQADEVVKVTGAPAVESSSSKTTDAPASETPETDEEKAAREEKEDQWVQKFDELAQAAADDGVSLKIDLELGEETPPTEEEVNEAKSKNEAALEALKISVESAGGKFFRSLEEYVESLSAPADPSVQQEPGEQPGVQQDPKDAKDGATGANGPGNTDHVTTQKQNDGAAQPGVGQTND